MPFPPSPLPKCPDPPVTSEAWVLQTWRSTGTGYAYGTRNLVPNRTYFYLVILS